MVSVRQWVLAAGIAASFSAAADPYTIDPNHTYPSLEFTHMGISIWRGKFNKTTGKVTLDRNARSGSVEVQVDTATIDFGLDRMNQAAISEDWLNVAKFPTMSYRGAIKFNGDMPTAVDGELTLLGVTKPLRLSINSLTCIAHPRLKREVCGADAEGDMHRADFGLTQYSEGELGRIHLRIQVEAIKDE
jgi:polyisoprenoid-binding protein YceI